MSPTKSSHPFLKPWLLKWPRLQLSRPLPNLFFSLKRLRPQLNLLTRFLNRSRLRSTTSLFQFFTSRRHRSLKKRQSSYPQPARRMSNRLPWEIMTSSRPRPQPPSCNLSRNLVQSPATRPRHRRMTSAVGHLISCQGSRPVQLHPGAPTPPRAPRQSFILHPIRCP